jgi:hypothetical protein
MATPAPETESAKYVRPVLYPVQLVIMVSEEVGARVDADRKAAGVSKSEVARRFLDDGIAVADTLARAAS